MCPYEACFWTKQESTFDSHFYWLSLYYNCKNVQTESNKTKAKGRKITGGERMKQDIERKRNQEIEKRKIEERK